MVRQLQPDDVELFEKDHLTPVKDEQSLLNKNIGDQELAIGYDDTSALLPDFFKLAE